MKPILAVIATCLALPAAAQDIAAGAALYEAYCAACHGPGGQGDGRMAEVLRIAPPDLTQIAARAGGPFPVAEVVFQIDGRNPILAHGGDMPIFGRWFDAELPSVAVATAAGQPLMTSRPIADLLGFLAEIQQ